MTLEQEQQAIRTGITGRHQALGALHKYDRTYTTAELRASGIRPGDDSRWKASVGSCLPPAADVGPGTVEIVGRRT